MKRQMRNGGLILALGILSLSTLTLHTTAQKPPIAPPPTTKEEPRLPDLAIYSASLVLSPSSLSIYNPVYDLVVAVVNRVDVAAPTSMATVVFKVNGNNQSSSQPVAGFSGTGTRFVRFRVPNGCFDPANQLCSYTITVDSGNQVQESNEGNNTVSDSQPKPIPPPTTATTIAKNLRPDLVPYSTDIGSSSGPFCTYFGGSRLAFFVENQGEAAAPASTVAVAFKVYGAGGDQFVWVSYDKPVPSLPGLGAGKSEKFTMVEFEVPKRCNHPDYRHCEFRITVDSSRQVLESREDNNTARAKCGT